MPGLLIYPILIGDILLHHADKVPVGKDPTTFELARILLNDLTISTGRILSSLLLIISEQNW